MLHLKLVFFFDYVTGLPCLPGHGIKGLLRTAFPNHKDEKYPNSKAEYITTFLTENSINLQEKFNNYLSQKGITNVPYSPLRFSSLLGEIIFEGKEPYKFENGEFCFNQIALYNKDIFHDAYILNSGEDGLFLANDYITHHENALKDPNPVQFLKILPNTGIQF